MLKKLTIITGLSYQFLAAGEPQDSIKRECCLCGVNQEILDKIESLVYEARQSQCPAGTNPLPEANGSNANVTIALDDRGNGEIRPIDELVPPSVSTEPVATEPSSTEAAPVALTAPSGPAVVSTSDNQPSISQTKRDPPELSLTTSSGQSQSTIQNQFQMSHQSGQGVSASVQLPSQTFSASLTKPEVSIVQTHTSKPMMVIHHTSNLTVGSSYLHGLAPQNSNNEALIKLNKTTKVDLTDIQDALQSTVPEVVSNIFSNINHMIEVEQRDPDVSVGTTGTLTSIDGSSVSVAGDTSAQIMAEGEKLFLGWIEHQLNTVHLSASVVNYIRKNALILFRRVVRQYVLRISKVGGSIEENVRKATQMALSNTQNLTAFILRNYVNFAGGLLRIIGEQVSRVGKNLDTTGNTIKEINLNPFDIVSNVIESLPNPATYSEYFRNVGRHLLGQSNDNAPVTPQPASASPQAAEASSASEEPKRRGLLSQTVGSLGKTFSSWLG